MAEAIAVGIFFRVAGKLSTELDRNTKINPYAITLEQDRWESEGLLDGSGLTPAEADEIAEGIDFLFQTEIPVPQASG